MDSVIRFPLKIFRGVLWRTMRLSRLNVLHAPPVDMTLLFPEGLILFQADKAADASKREQMEISMQAMDEPAGLVEKRLERGDEFFGWLDGERIVSFGWVTYSKRVLGTVCCKDVPGRVFLYNFATFGEYRGRGLYPALLCKMRQILGCGGATEMVIDVNSSNLSSIRGIEKAGFTPVAQLVSVIVFSRWQFLLKQVSINHTVKDLF